MTPEEALTVLLDFINQWSGDGTAFSAHDLELAFYRRMTELTPPAITTARPDQIFDPAALAATQPWRRGVVLGPNPQTEGFGDGVYTRLYGVYQIDVYVPMKNNGALKEFRTLLDAHVAQFWPANGRGISLTKNNTTAHITRRPSQRNLDREGAYLRGLVEVDFYVEVLPSAS